MKKIYLSLLALSVFIVNSSSNQWEFWYKTCLPSNAISAIAIAGDGTRWFGVWNSGVVSYKDDKFELTELGQSGRVKAIEIDANNGLWIGSEYGGLTHIDASGKKTNYLGFESIFGISIDKNNIKWLATLSGLVKYNGTEFTTYKKSNSEIVDEYCTSVLTDANGTVWVGTLGGLSSFDGTTWTNYTKENGKLPSNRIRKMVLDKSDTLWLGTDDNGLIAFKNGNYKHYYPTTYYVTYNFQDLTIDENGTLWAAVANQYTVVSWEYVLLKHEGTTFTQIRELDGKTIPLQLWNVKAEKNGKLWLGFADKGLMHFNGTKWEQLSAPSEIRSIAIDKNGNPCISSDKGGIWAFDGTKWKIYNVFNSPLKSNYNQQVVFDKNNVLWAAGYEGGGLGRLKDNVWNYYTPANSSLSSTELWSLAFDQQDNLWIGTHYEGLNKFDGTNFTVYKDTVGKIPGFLIKKIAVDIDSSLWMAGNEFLLHWKDTTLASYNTSNSLLPSNWINDVICDNKGVKWVSTANGLVKIDKNKWTAYTTSNSSLPDFFVRDLAVDTNNILWATFNGGIGRFENEKWEFFSSLNSSLPSGYPGALTIDKENNVWIGIYSLGLVKLKYTAKDSVPENDTIPDTDTLPDGIEVRGSEPLLFVYPNPASSFITANLSGETYFNVTISGIEGKILLNYFDVPNHHPVDISELKPGLYLLGVKSKDGIVCHKKFLKY